MEIKKFKPLIKDLIQYYYNYSPDNGCGGYLHAVLDDGNIEHSSIQHHQEDCEKNNDSLGGLICDVLLEFTEEELEEMYNSDFWGMDL